MIAQKARAISHYTERFYHLQNSWLVVLILLSEYVSCFWSKRGDIVALDRDNSDHESLKPTTVPFEITNNEFDT